MSKTREDFKKKEINKDQIYDEIAEETDENFFLVKKICEFQFKKLSQHIEMDAGKEDERKNVFKLDYFGKFIRKKYHRDRP